MSNYQQLMSSVLASKQHTLITGRLNGKSSQLAMFAAHVLETKPGIRVNIITPGLRASLSFMKFVEMYTNERMKRVSSRHIKVGTSHLRVSHGCVEIVDNNCAAPDLLLIEAYDYASPSMQQRIDDIIALGTTTVIGFCQTANENSNFHYVCME